MVEGGAAAFSLASQRKFKVHALNFLYRCEDAGKIGGRRATFRPEHTHQTLGWNLRTLFQVLKPKRRVDVVSQDGLAGFKVSVQDALYGFAQKGLPEIRVALGARMDGFLEVVGEWHY